MSDILLIRKGDLQMDIVSPETLKIFITQGVFCILFVWLLYDTRKESKVREEKLIAQIEKSEEQHAQIIHAIEILSNKIS